MSDFIAGLILIVFFYLVAWGFSLMALALLEYIL